MKHLQHETRVIADWSSEFVVAVTLADKDRAAKAAATLIHAAQAVQSALDPAQKVSPAITLVNGTYIAPSGEVQS